MINQPLVSICIPAYNHEQYIEKCLDSILKDNYVNKEIVIINDGSTDSTGNLIDNWIEINNEDIPIIYKSRENKGMIKTLNELISKSTGEYIIILASDDYLLPGGIDNRLTYLRNNRDKMAVIGDCIVVDNNGNKLYESGIEGLYRGRKKFLLNDKLLAEELIFRWCLPGPIYMVKKKFFDLFGLYSDEATTDDFDLVLRLVSQDRLGFLDLPVAAYRLHDSNAKDKLTSGHYKDWRLQTVTDHLSKFRGLRWFMLFTDKVKFTSRKYKREGKPIKSFCLYLYYQFLKVVRNASYKIKASYFLFKDRH